MPEVEALLPSLRSVERELLDRGVEAVHVVGPGPMGWVGVQASRRCGLPLIASFHTDLVAYAEAWFTSRLPRRAVRRLSAQFYGQASAWTAPSEHARRVLSELIEVPASRISLLPQGVDRTRFSAADDSLRPARTRRRILCVSRLSREKRLDVLLRMAHELDEPADLVLVGRGPEADRLRRLAARLGVALHLTGPLEGRQLVAAYRDADVFCLPSTTETFGQVLIEAQSSGLPCVVVPGGAAVEAVGGAGKVAASASPSCLARAVAEVLTDERTRRSLIAAGSAHAASRPWSRTAEALQQAYGLLLARQPARARSSLSIRGPASRISRNASPSARKETPEKYQ